MLMNSLLDAVTWGKRGFGILFMVLMGVVLSTHTAVAVPEAPQALLPKPVIANDLPLHRLLCLIDQNIRRQLSNILLEEDNTTDEAENNFLLLLADSQAARELIESIVKDFNESTAPLDHEIEEQFIKLCTFNANVAVGSTKQRHVRALVHQVESFNEFVERSWHQKRSTLKASDKVFYNRLTQLNQLLLQSLLDDEYIDAGLLDDVADLLVYRPLELMAENKELTALVVGVVCAYAGYCCYQILSMPYTVTQCSGCPQRSLDCGYYGLFHDLILVHVNGDEARARQYIEQAKKNPRLLEPWKQYIAQQRVQAVEECQKVYQKQLETLDSDVDKRFAELSQKDQAVGKKALKDKMCKDRHRALLKAEEFARTTDDLRSDEMQKLLDPAQEGLINQVLGTVITEEKNVPSICGNVAVVEQLPANSYQEEKIEILYGALNNSIKKVKEQKVSQGVVLRIPGHWIAVHIKPDDQSPCGVKACVIDSLNWNRKYDSNVKSLLDRYATKKDKKGL